MSVPAKKVLDPVQVFEAYLAFSGNLTKVALATDVDIETIARLAKEGDWQSRIKQLDELGAGNRQEVQIAINRGINYVQATRLRSLLDKIIQHLGEGSSEDLIQRLTVATAHGLKFGTRPLTDLVKAAESVQLMTQRALGDVPSERPEAKESGKSSIALSVMAALSAAENLKLDSVQVVKEQLATPHDDPRNSPTTR